MQELLNVIKELMQKSTHFIHPVGAFYLKFQMIFKVLFVKIIIDEVFEGPTLVCDTLQVGCNEMCVNRFAPITFIKLWQLEMWLVLIGTGFFMMFVFVNTHLVNPDNMRVVRRFLNIHEKRLSNGKIIIHSKFISLGYVVVLILRLAGELYFLNLEYQLAVHQTGRLGLEAFRMPENYHCATNIDSKESRKPNWMLLEHENQSPIRTTFYIEDPLIACSQSRVEVTCWIPKSRMQSIFLLGMFGVSLISACLSVLELSLVWVTQCCKQNFRNQTSTKKSNADKKEGSRTGTGKNNRDAGYITRLSPYEFTFKDLNNNFRQEHNEMSENLRRKSLRNLDTIINIGDSNVHRASEQQVGGPRKEGRRSVRRDTVMPKKEGVSFNSLR